MFERSKRVTVAAGLSAVSIFIPTLSAQAEEFKLTASNGAAYVADELLVKFRAPPTVQFRASILSQQGDRQLRSIDTRGYALVKLQSGRSVFSAMTAYRAMSDVESVQPNYIYRFSAAPNDAHYGQLWALRNIGQTVAGESYPSAKVAGSDMRLEEAWDRRTDCSSVIVAVLDSGVNYRHRDLAGNMWDGSAFGLPHHGFDFADNDNDPMPADANGHGTHVAATVGAVGNNAAGVTGVCWKASLMALRIGGNDGATTASIIQGLDFAVAHGAKVVNMSFGGPNRDPALERSIENARSKGVIAVVASGNDGTNNDNPATPAFPCSFPHDNIICVAALDQAYELARFSNIGATTVDVAAPGANILSAWPGSVIADDLTGWTRSGGWNEVVCNFTGGTSRVLANPVNWCGSSPSYAPNANDVAYKTFNLSGATHAQAEVLAIIDLEPARDFFGVSRSGSGGDPFVTNPTAVAEATGTSNGQPARGLVNLNNCTTTVCTLGFRLRTDANISRQGIGIVRLRIDTVQPDSDAYVVASGTSMAAPHVAGVVALVWAQKPLAPYADVINAVKQGGDAVSALAGKTVTGRAVNALGALRFIDPPTATSQSN